MQDRNEQAARGDENRYRSDDLQDGRVLPDECLNSHGHASAERFNRVSGSAKVR